MPSFVVLGNYTEQGMANMKELPTRLEAAKGAIDGAGGRMIFFYLTMGAYDFVSVAEAPDAAAAARVMLEIAGRGNVRTTTMQAFTEEEAAEIAGSLT